MGLPTKEQGCRGSCLKSLGFSGVKWFAVESLDGLKSPMCQKLREGGHVFCILKNFALARIKRGLCAYVLCIFSCFYRFSLRRNI